MLDTKKISQLIRSSKGDSAALNGALIACAAVWGLKAGELCKVEDSDVIDTKGRLKAKWLLRPEVAFNGYKRDMYTEHKSLVKYLEAYLSERGKHPSGILFISPRTVEPFSFGGSRPLEMNAYMKRLLVAAGLGQYSYKDFRPALMIEMWRYGQRVPVVKVDIMRRLGIRAYSAVDKTCKRDIGEISSHLRGIHSRL